MIDDHLKILETPLFRVRNKKETIYCYSEDERSAAVEKIGQHAEITRFKGLGEISPHEFKSFIQEDGIRLSPVKINNDASIEQIINFYMGKNTPVRREYIMNHLVIDSEMM